MRKKILYILPIVVVAVIAVIVSYFTTMKTEGKNSIEKELISAEKYYDEENYQKALSSYAKAIDENNQKISAYTGKARAYIAIKQYNNAKKTLETAVDIIKSFSNNNTSIMNDAKEAILLYAELLHNTEDTSTEYSTIVYGNSICDGLFKEYYGVDYIKADENANVSKLDSTCSIDENGYIIAGWYPNRELKGDELEKKITLAEYNTSGNAYIDGNLYKREKIDDVYRYFIYEPIKWFVLNEDKNKYDLITVNAIDEKAYNDELTDIDWDNCTLRSWINNDFIIDTFAQPVISNLLVMTVKPSVNYHYWNTSGTTVSDNATIIQAGGVFDGVNGFKDALFQKSTRRACTPTDYAVAHGVLMDSNGQCRYWLNSVGNTNEKVGFVNYDGVVAIEGSWVNTDNIGIRPVISMLKSAISQ